MIIWEVSRFRSGHIADNLLRHLEKGVDELEAYTGMGGTPALRLELFDLSPEMEGADMGCMWSPYRWLAFHFPSHKL